jgi:hypothetical protein
MDNEVSLTVGMDVRGQVLSNQLSIDYPSDYLVDILHNRMLLGTTALFYKVSNNPINWFPKFGL